ncbi:MAG: TraB/GumN family protein [Kiloniellales bacterium]
MRLKARPDPLYWLVPRVALAAFVLTVLLVGRLAPAAGELPYGQGLLWKLERPGLAPSYLFGTIHITDQRVLDLPPEVERAFDASRSAIFEVIMTDDLRTRLARAMVLRDGRTLDTILSPELYREAMAAGARYGLGPEQLKFLKPWALAMFFSVPQVELARSATGQVPLDQWLQNQARAQGKPVYALETGAEQIALFNELTEADQLAMLESAIQDNAEIEALFEDMTARYLARDIGGIHTQMMMQSKSMNEQLLKLFLLRFNEARNRTMAARLVERLAEGGAFVAVGALHLPGETGLVSLLADQGYRVERAY